MDALRKRLPFINLILLLLASFALSMVYLRDASIPSHPRDVQFGMQMMDLEWIRESFWQCIVYNHYQPPLFGNIFIGLLYIFVRDQMIPIYFMFSYTISLLAFVGLIYLLNKLGIRQIWILLFGLLYAAYPARWQYEAQVFYPLPSLFLLTSMAVFFYKSLETKRVGYLAAAYLTGTALTLINSFFHFLFIILIFVAMLVLARMTANLRARMWLLIALVLTLIVPVKNYIVFGFLGSSSCSGIVLVQRSHVMRLQLEGHTNAGDIIYPSYDYYTGKSYLGYEAPQRPEFSKIKCLALPYKEYGSRKDDFVTFNFNYWKVWAASKRMIQDALWLMRRYPNQYLAGTVYQFKNFFSGEGGAWDPTLNLPNDRAFDPRLAVRGCIYILGVLGLLLYLTIRPFNKEDTRQSFLFFILIIILYALFMGIMVAYLDGPRYRFPFEIYFILAAAWAVDSLSRLIFRGSNKA